MIVVAIVGILAAIAIPNYLNYQAKAQQVEAKTNLGAIFQGMISYAQPNSLNGFAGATITDIGFRTHGTTRYTYSIVSTTTNTFLAQADGISGWISGDAWTIDEGKALVDVDPTDFNN